MQEKKRLRYRCEERFFPGQKCKSLELNVIALLEDEAQEGDGGQLHEEEEQIEEVTLDHMELLVEAW